MVTKVTKYLHAGHLFKIAKRAAANVTEDPDAAVVAIMFSVLALEAFINESGALARMVPSDDRQTIVEGFSAVIGELEERKEALLVKYHIGLLVFSGATWNEGDQPFQNFKLLVGIRNSIVHMKADAWKVKVESSKPDPERTLDQYPKFVSVLQQKKLIELPTSSSSWFEVISQPKVAQWACTTASIVMQEFLKVVPDGYFKESLLEHIEVG